MTISFSGEIYVLSNSTQLKTMLQALTSHNVPGALVILHHGRHHEVVLGVLQRFIDFLSAEESIKEVCSHAHSKNGLVNCNSKTILDPSEN